MRHIHLLALASACTIGAVLTPAERQRGRLMRAPDHTGDGPAWFFGPDNAQRVFEPGDTIPAGWEDHPSKVKGAAPAGGGVHTARTSANGPVSEATVAKSTTSQSDTIVDPAIAATKGVGGLGDTAATGDTASQLAASSPSTDKPEVDADGHPFDPALHAATKSKTKDGKWRMKVGVTRPAPAPGYPLDL